MLYYILNHTTQYKHKERERDRIINIMREYSEWEDLIYNYKGNKIVAVRYDVNTGIPQYQLE
jgi:hypothetical protein